MTDNWHKCNVLLHVRQCFHLAAVKHHQTLRLSAAGGRQTHFRGDKHGFLLLPEMILTENEVGEVLRQSCRLRHLDLEINPQKTFMSYTQLQLRSIEICDLCWQNESEWAHFQQLLLLFSFSIKITSKLYMTCWNRTKNGWATAVWRRKSQQIWYREKSS